MDRITERTGIPLGWVLSGMAVVVTSAVMGTFWVAMVNTRLSRIEDKLGIKPYDIAVIPRAQAE